jgi:glycosyltransferase involved in cell wall biosynthesis
MSESQQPLVSCIMPTYNRREFVPHAIRYFLRQDYENMELIVIDDGEDPIEDLIPKTERLRYYRLDKKISLGAKLNMACQCAKGDIIAHWDDDDWYAHRRLKYQVNAIQANGFALCGINNLLYYDVHLKNAYRYIYPKNQRTWLLGSSLCYKKELWNKIHFADIDVGMDGLFVWATPPAQILVLPDPTIAVHMIHQRNVSPKHTDGSWWHTYPVDEIKTIMGSDWAVYSNGKITAAPDVKVHKVKSGDIQTQTKELKNVYACLVHENEDCVIDLVRNLHYHDPNSTILVYNGGTDPGLFHTNFPYNKFGVVFHPKPTPATHGYLHSFAFDCMEFAQKNFSFDCLTIVDSDQLLIRPGYSECLNQFFSGTRRIGMLSSKPERVLQNDKTNHVALQAFKEYDLWRPLLDSFPDGESKFVHWTFWPSTVFTADAIKELIELIKTNKLVQNVINNTKIWATEEVILPTLISLLGYEIGQNPSSIDFVKYRKSFTIQDVNLALNKPDAYWIHPIERKYADPLRKYIRDKFNNYSMGDDFPLKSSNTGFQSRLHLINEMKQIGGWLSEKEADLLITSTITCLENLSPPYHIVEIGSYHGKSTILFGSIAKELFPGTKVYAIDTHDGKLGAADQGLQSFPPSFEMFKKNIETAELTEVVEIIVNNSYNVEWEKNISLLFIDGLHDYFNVARDFRHFSNWIRPGGYVAFHDYATYFPGVMAFVHELLQEGAYQKTAQVASLIVVQKR